MKHQRWCSAFAWQVLSSGWYVSQRYEEIKLTWVRCISQKVRGEFFRVHWMWFKLDIQHVSVLLSEIDNGDYIVTHCLQKRHWFLYWVYEKIIIHIHDNNSTSTQLHKCQKSRFWCSQMIFKWAPLLDTAHTLYKSLRSRKPTWQRGSLADLRSFTARTILIRVRPRYQAYRWRTVLTAQTQQVNCLQMDMLLRLAS